jgi:hypothetical protein
MCFQVPWLILWTVYFRDVKMLMGGGARGFRGPLESGVSSRGEGETSEQPWGRWVGGGPRYHSGHYAVSSSSHTKCLPGRCEAQARCGSAKVREMKVSVEVWISLECTGPTLFRLRGLRRIVGMWNIPSAHLFLVVRKHSFQSTCSTEV